MHILHTVLYTFPNELTRRICLTSKSLFKMGGGSLCFQGEQRGNQSSPTEYKGGRAEKNLLPMNYQWRLEGIIGILHSLTEWSGKFWRYTTKILQLLPAWKVWVRDEFFETSSCYWLNRKTIWHKFVTKCVINLSQKLYHSHHIYRSCVIFTGVCRHKTLPGVCIIKTNCIKMKCRTI